jgi:hypothetical protein
MCQQFECRRDPQRHLAQARAWIAREAVSLRVASLSDRDPDALARRAALDTHRLLASIQASVVGGVILHQ